MTQPEHSNEMMDDPSGSIFLTKTQNPDREFENWKLQLLMGRGVGEGKTHDQIMELYEKLKEARARHLGDLAVGAV